MFADDTALVTESSEQLQRLVTDIRRVCERKRLRVRMEKNKIYGVGKGRGRARGRSLNEWRHHGGCEFFQVLEKMFQ